MMFWNPYDELTFRFSVEEKDLKAIGQLKVTRGAGRIGKKKMEG